MALPLATYYDVLSVPTNASEEDIKNAFKQKMVDLHKLFFKDNDSFYDAESEVADGVSRQRRERLLKEAFTVLSNDLLRRQYDSELPFIITKNNNHHYNSKQNYKTAQRNVLTQQLQTPATRMPTAASALDQRQRTAERQNKSNGEEEENVVVVVIDNNNNNVSKTKNNNNINQFYEEKTMPDGSKQITAAYFYIDDKEPDKNAKESEERNSDKNDKSDNRNRNRRVRVMEEQVYVFVRKPSSDPSSAEA